MFALKTRRRNRLRSEPIPDSWKATLQHNVPYYSRLSSDDQRELERLIRVFVAEKNFEGCGGLEMNEEIKVTISAYACILLLHVRHDYYPRLKSVLVYPDIYSVAGVRRGVGNIVVEGQEIRAGESWPNGVVVVTWDPTLHQPTDASGGRNVVLHEFAHQLDQEDGFANGAPLLPTTSMYRAWARILGREYQTLSEAAEIDRPTFLDKYGATNPAEFFAVVTEYFFEQPHQLKHQHPELYGELKLYYGQDPASQP